MLLLVLDRTGTPLEATLGRIWIAYNKDTACGPWATISRVLPYVYLQEY